MNKCFNDLLGIRIVVDNYEEILKEDLSLFKIANLLKGKVKDDGYRGIHLYYQKSNIHYPIEIQINTEKDRIFNDWLHCFFYKRNISANIGLKLRQMYDDNMIRTKNEFEEVLENVLLNSKEI